MTGSRVLFAVGAALIGAGAGLFVGLWAVSGAESALALVLVVVWGPLIGGLLGLAAGWVVAVFSWWRGIKP